MPVRSSQSRRTQGSELRIKFSQGQSVPAGLSAVDFLSFGYRFVFNDKLECTVRWQSAEQDQFRRHLADFASGTLDEEAVRWTASVLQKFIFPSSCNPEEKYRFLDNGDSEIRLTAAAKVRTILTNVPWEMTYVTAGANPRNGSLFGSTLGRYAMARIARGRAPKAVADGQIRALYCISNPAHPLLRSFQADEYQNALESVFRGFPVIDKRDMLSDHKPSWDKTEATIAAVRPHLFILIGHGQSASGPELLFENRWVPVSRLAEALAATKSNVLAVLVCCDQVRISENPGAQSGAISLVEEGIPGVVAMQGMIDPPVAEVFLKTFLNHLLIRPSVAIAAAAGRQEALRTSLQGFLPTVFLNEKGTPSFFSNVLGRYKQGLQPLINLLPDSKPDLERREPEIQLGEAFDKTGVVLVKGGLGTGKTHLISKIARQRLTGLSVPARPIFYVACDRLVDGGTMRRTVFRELAKRFGSSTKLLPQSVPLAVDDAASIVAGIEGRRIIVVLDGFSGNQRKADWESWTKLFDYASGMQKSLFVVIAKAGSSMEISSSLEISVPSFRVSETSQYLRNYVPKLAGSYQRIHRWSGGSPLFLDALRRFQKDLGGQAIRGKISRKGGPRQMADTYVQRVTGLLSSEELQTLCNLCRVPRPAPIALCERFLDETKNKVAIDRLIAIGIAETSGDEAHPLCSVSGGKAQAVRRAQPARFRAGAALLVDHFQAWLEDQSDLEDAIAKLMTQPGGAAILQGLQAAYLDMKQEMMAVTLATMANVPGANEDEIWALYAAGIGAATLSLKTVVAERKPGSRKILSFLLRAAELAQTVGRHDDCKSLLADLDSLLSPNAKPSKKSRNGNQPSDSFGNYYDRALFLKTKAARLKDMEQDKALPEINRSYAEAIAIARQGMAGTLKDEGATLAEWKDLLLEILQERLNTRIFLEHAAHEELEADIHELEGSGGESRHLGLVLCKLAERELQQDDKSVNWSIAQENLVRAKGILTKTADALTQSYCLYQYAQYLRRLRPNPEAASAIENYAKAEALGRQGGDPRRAGLAMRRRVKLLWQQHALDDIDDVSSQIGDLISDLERRTGDSLTLRVLERLYSLRAEISRGRLGETTERYLYGACRASADPLLSAKTDVEHCGRAFHRYLQFLNETRRFDVAETFVMDFSDTLTGKLHLDLKSKNPWTVCDLLAEKYPDPKED